MSTEAAVRELLSKAKSATSGSEALAFAQAAHTITFVGEMIDRANTSKSAPKPTAENDTRAVTDESVASGASASTNPKATSAITGANSSYGKALAKLAEGAPTEPATLDYERDVRPPLYALAELHGRDAANAVLAQFKVKKGTELKPGQWPAFVAAIAEAAK